MEHRRQYPSHPLVGAGSIIHRGGKVLLVRRKYPPHQGKWAVPGGLVELGEKVEEAAAREAFEETGLTVKVETLLDVSSDISFDGNSNLEYHYVLIDYVARASRGRVKLNAESSEYGWFTSKEVKKLEMSDGTRAALTKYFRQHRPSAPDRGALFCGTVTTFPCYRSATIRDSRPAALNAFSSRPPPASSP